MALTARSPTAPRLRPVLVRAPDRITKDPEEEALAALEAGDLNSTLQILMDAYGTAIFRFCRALVKNPDLAEEAHQLTFVQAFESLPTFAHRSSLRSWLFGIARHRCLDGAKTYRRRERRFELVDTPPDGHQTHPHPEDLALERDRSFALRECLLKLPGRIRNAVLLRYQQGLSYVEMEEIGNDRAATLQARVARALPRLRSCLEGRGFRW